ncbi:MAG: pyrroline-5-carboxylate reductase [Gallionella sp.]
MNICFIGGGNMASAIMGGLVSNKTCKPDDIRVVEINSANRTRLEKQNFLVFDKQDREAIEGCDVIVLAVKPLDMPEVGRQLGSKLSTGQIVLSIAAGIRLSDLARWLGHMSAGYILVRAMPNTPALVGAGMTCIGLQAYPPFLSEDQKSKLETIFGAIGSFVWVRGEDDMDAVTAISGSGPAYFFYFIEALEQAGKELGLPEAIARKLALETAFGAAKLARESTEDPATLRARVTSKNGTTERALLSMEEKIAASVKQRIITAAQAAAARSREMGIELGKA